MVSSAKKKILSQIKKEAKAAQKIYLATDPDREGEAIGWHIKEKLNQDEGKYLRVVFHEITPAAIKEAFNHPSQLDINKVNAQTGRRVLDRLVGYFLSPLLWRKIAGGTFRRTGAVSGPAVDCGAGTGDPEICAFGILGD